MIFTNAAAKRDFYFIRHFGVKIVAESFPVSSRGRVKKVLLLTILWLLINNFFFRIFPSFQSKISTLYVVRY